MLTNATRDVTDAYSVVTIQYSPLSRRRGLKTATKNKIQAGCTVVAALAAVASAFYAHSASSRADTQEASVQWNEKVDTRIATSGKLGTIQASLDRIESRLSTLEGWKEGVSSQVRLLNQRQDKQDKANADLRLAADAQKAINNLQDPSRILAVIQGEMRQAEAARKALPPAQVADFRNAMRAIPSSANQYWTTVAAIINYQSFVNQIANLAPDPASVASFCFGLTNAPGRATTQNNLFSGAEFSNCIVDLDRNVFENITFVNSVIRYSGGSTNFRNITFRNCRFVLNIPPTSQQPQRPDLLLTLLDRVSNPTLTIAR